MCSESPEDGSSERRPSSSVGTRPPIRICVCVPLSFFLRLARSERVDVSMIWSFRGAFGTNFRFPRSDDVRPIDRRTQFLVDSMKVRVCRISSTDNKSFNFGCHFLTRDGTRQSLVP